MPAYKATNIREAITSILSQSCKDFELIIVDDCSPYNLKEIVDEFQDSRIRYYRNKENIGGKNLVKQWNNCLELAKGDFVVLSPDDDIYHPCYLEKMLAIADKHPEIKAFRCRIRLFDNNSDSLNFDLYLPEACDQLTFLYYFYRRYISSGIGQWMFRRKELVQCGGYYEAPKAWFSDDATALLMTDEGVGICNDELFKMRVSGESISSAKNDYTAFSEKLAASEKFYNLFHRWCSERNNHPDYETSPSPATLWRIFHNFYIAHIVYLMDNTRKIDLIKALPLIRRINKLGFPTIIKHILR